MGSLPSSLLVLFLFLFGNLSEARRDPEEYWKRMMKGEPLPKAIRELVHGDPELAFMADEGKMEKKKWDPSSEIAINMAQFKKDFDTKPNLIIYHMNHAAERTETED
ncbi:hypothetical protein U1Q18_003869 [Sarracenia purpurea var. burkii]